jgi:cell division protein FtsB
MSARANRLIVPLAAVTAVALIAVWFPARTLLGQSAQLDTASHQISVLVQQSQSLAAQQKALSTSQAALLLARQEYQLVQPGQRIIQILSNENSATMATGDPGLAPLVSPSASQGLIPTNPTAPTTSNKPAGFWARVVRTLQFWR